jgi:NAD(P)-dependent dehydrogenase (short-subunit alcohol dehydrogenase family)
MTEGSALVTGASRGLGAQIARRLAADGRPVAVNYLPDRADAERVVAEIVAAGGTAAAFRADVTDEDDVAALVPAVERALGPVRVLVPNATGITVNVVAPGWIPVERHAGVDPRHLEEYRRDVPLGRLGTPAEIADVVAFLASDAARFVNGERITVNGGHAMD